MGMEEQFVFVILVMAACREVCILDLLQVCLSTLISYLILANTATLVN